MFQVCTDRVMGIHFMYWYNCDMNGIFNKYIMIVELSEPEKF